MTLNTNPQKAHYEAIHDDYEAHYFDASSMAYRERFIYDVLFQDLELNDTTIADLACGSGFNSKALLERFPRANVIGFDISARAVERYKEVTGHDSHELDLTSGELPEGVEPVDHAMVIGGLHHCVSDMDGTLSTLKQLVKPGGVLMMYEPNLRFVLETARATWYKFDKYFDADSERSIDHDELLEQTRGAFSGIDCYYMGGPAYFTIYNSLITRIPLRMKKRLEAPAFFAESIANKVPGDRWFPYFIARWRRNG